MSNHRTNELTGLRKCAYAQAVLEDLIADAQTGEKVGLISLCLDGYEWFEDEVQSEAMRRGLGTTYLTLLAQELGEIAGDERLVAHVGMASFWVVVPESEGAQTLQMAEAIRAGIERVAIPFQEEMICPVSLTLCVVRFPDDGQTAEELIEKSIRY